MRNLLPNAQAISAFGHEYSASGSRIATDELIGPAASSATRSRTGVYGYDALDRLISSTTPDEAFSYDAVGNRTSDGEVHDAANKLLSDNNYVYSHDGRGNRTSRTHRLTGERTEYNFSPENELLSVVIKADGTNPTRVVTFKYDALGRRYAKEYVDFVDASKSYSRKYVFDGRNIIAEIDASTNHVVATYLHGPGVNDVISMIRDRNNDQVLSVEEMFIFGRNSLGSITEVTSRTGVLKQRLRYSSYCDTKLGKTDTDQLDEWEFIETLFGYTGAVVVPEVGLVCMDYRCLDTQAGRWLNEDPIGFEGQDTNLYRYVNSAPIEYVDPEGKILMVPIVVGALSGASFELVSQLVLEDRKFECLDLGAILTQATVGGAFGGIGQLLARTKFVGQMIQKVSPKKDLLKTKSGFRFGVGRVGAKDVKESKNFLGLRKYPGTSERRVLRFGTPGKNNHIDILDLGPVAK